MDRLRQGFRSKKKQVTSRINLNAGARCEVPLNISLHDVPIKAQRRIFPPLRRIKQSCKTVKQLRWEAKDSKETG